jgi:hypothetical protein
VLVLVVWLDRPSVGNTLLLQVAYCVPDAAAGDASPRSDRCSSFLAAGIPPLRPDVRDRRRRAFLVVIEQPPGSLLGSPGAYQVASTSHYRG